MNTKRLNPHASISVDEAENAVYIDFEGFQDKSPCLLGILCDGKFKQVVFDDGLKLAADKSGLRVIELKIEIQMLTDMCKKQGRPLVAFSQHERNVILNYTGIDVADIYRDARMIAKKWKNRCRRNASIECRALKDYLAFIEFPRGSHLGEKKSTSRIKAVRDMLEKRGSYDDLTPVVKSKWTKLLDHNEIDCRGMEALVKIAAKELSALA